MFIASYSRSTNGQIEPFSSSSVPERLSEGTGSRGHLAYFRALRGPHNIEVLCTFWAQVRTGDWERQSGTGQVSSPPPRRCHRTSGSFANALSYQRLYCD